MTCQPIEFCDTAITDEQKDIVRDNWEKMGYEYWFTDYNNEYWRPVGSTDPNKSITLITE